MPLIRRLAVVALLLLVAGAAPCLGQQRQAISIDEPLGTTASGPDRVVDGDSLVFGPRLQAIVLAAERSARARPGSRVRATLYSLGGMVAGGFAGYGAHLLTLPTRDTCSEDLGLLQRCEARSYMFTLAGASLGALTGLAVGVMRSAEPEPAAEAGVAP